MRETGDDGGVVARKVVQLDSLWDPVVLLGVFCGADENLLVVFACVVQFE
jgi:hypothetical protein